MTTTISPAAGSTTTNPTTTPSGLGPVIVDAPATGATDTFTSAPAATVPTTTAPAAAPALPTATTTTTTTATKPNDKFVKWSTFDSSLPFFKHLSAFLEANIAALKEAKA